MLAFCLGCQTQKYPIRESFNGVAFEYGTPFTLGKKARNNLLVLASQCGLTNIQKVASNYMLPTSDIVFQVQGNETVKGKEIRYRSLSINYRRWNSGWQPPREMVQCATNGFEVFESYTHRVAVVNLEGREIRVRIDESIPVDLVDEIVQKIFRKEFESEKYAYGLRLLDRDLELATIESISVKDGDKFEILFWRGGSGNIYRFSRDSKNGKLTLVSVGSVVA